MFRYSQTLNEPRHEKTCLRGLRPSKTHKRCTSNIFVLYWQNLFIHDYNKKSDSISVSKHMTLCTHLTFDLIQRLRSIYRLGIHLYLFCHRSRNNISMGRIMYSILLSNIKISIFFQMGFPTILTIKHVTPCKMPQLKTTVFTF